jgi:hypothetical protein
MKIKYLILLLALSLAPNLFATDVDLEGYWSYYLYGTRSYSSSGYAASGRYSRLGSGYYRYGYLDGGDISNNSYYTRSGSLSLEFWRLNYYGGSYGNIMFTRGFSSLSPGYYYGNIYRNGYFKSPGRYGYGDLSLAEYQGSWVEVDNLSYTGYRYF